MGVGRFSSDAYQWLKTHFLVVDTSLLLVLEPTFKSATFLVFFLTQTVPIEILDLNILSPSILPTPHVCEIPNRQFYQSHYNWDRHHCSKEEKSCHLGAYGFDFLSRYGVLISAGNFKTFTPSNPPGLLWGSSPAWNIDLYASLH